jgi:predicted Fe-Mo cluster-binding NifX family protein
MASSLLFLRKEERQQGESMKTAFPFWQNRIAPVFDTARMLWLIESNSGRRVGGEQLLLGEEQAIARVVRLVEAEIDNIVCGALSRQVHGLLQAYGIKVIPFVAGDLDEVVQAFLTGALAQGNFAMPGCRRGKGHRHRGGF